MKKFIPLIIASIFAGLNCFTQTLNGSAFPTIGSIYTMTLADTAGVQPGSTGMGVTWDFSSLVNSGKTQVDSFLLPSATPFGSTFPTANIAVHQVALPTDYYVYYHDNGSAYQRIGNAQPDVVIYSDPADEFPYPVSFGTNLNDTYYSSYMSGGSTVHMSGTTNLNADGTGTVITPAGTYSGVLRITGTRDEHDTIFGTPSIMIHLISTYVSWYQPVLYYPVMQIITTHIYPSLGPASFQKTVGYRAGVPDGINELRGNDNAVNVTPNPSSTGIFIFRLKNVKGMIRQLDITDITGRIVYAGKRNVSEIHLCGSAKGVYFYQIQTFEGNFYSGKLMIE
jgi:hypothetical protein